MKQRPPKRKPKLSTPLLFSILYWGLVVLIVLFLWGENLEFGWHKTINANKFAAFGTMVAALLTATTVYLLYQQNKQQIEDRYAASKPDLYPASADYSTQDKCYPGITRPVFYIDDEKNAKESILINLFNIGLGAAKEIKINWEYNKGDVSEFIKDAYPDQIGNVFNAEYALDFIAPSNSDKIYFPYYFAICFGDKIGSTNPNSPYPCLFLNVKFKDIYNNEWSKDFLVTANVIIGLVFIKFIQVDALKKEKIKMDSKNQSINIDRLL